MTILLTLLSLCAFSANSLLCRLALRGGHIDAAGFTAVRMASGVGMLVVLALGTGRKPFARRGGASALALFAYAICFSFAYLSLNAATGALIAFASVQITMMAGGFLRGERHGGIHWIGFAVAAAGLVYLLWPGLSAPPFGAAALMVGAGTAWGVYSLLGKGETDPLARTAWNFLLAAPLALIAVAVHPGALHFTARGVGLAVLSGAVTSGLGYVAWYAALRGLTATRAALVQLSVPVLTGAAAVAFLGESATPRLVVSGLLVLGGISASLLDRPGR